MGAPDEFPIFELDEASRPMFAASSHQGQAQHHFVFAPQGTTETIELWARLVQCRKKRKVNFLWHQVALWPQGAEPGRVFFTGCYKACFSEKTSEFDFDWDCWQKRFEDENGGLLERYWVTTEDGQSRLLRFQTNGWGSAISSSLALGHGFDWGVRNEETLRRVQELRFLQMSNDEFDRQMLLKWNNPQNSIRFESDWLELSREERDALAFECEHGEWDELIRLARLVLTARLGREACNSGRVHWNFFCFIPINIQNAQEQMMFENDPFLLCWRALLFDYFRPRHARFIGLSETIPSCIRCHFQSGNPRTRVAVEPSQHEVLEARNKLKEWAHQHIDIHSARVLMALL